MATSTIPKTQQVWRSLIDALSSRVSSTSTSSTSGSETTPYPVPDPASVAFRRLIDHTQLSVTATPAQIDALCEEAWRWDFGAVCVRAPYVARCVENLAKYPAGEDGRSVGVASVVGFHEGTQSVEEKMAEITTALTAGATELDLVLDPSSFYPSQFPPSSSSTTTSSSSTTSSSAQAAQDEPDYAAVYHALSILVSHARATATSLHASSPTTSSSTIYTGTVLLKLILETSRASALDPPSTSSPDGTSTSTSTSTPATESSTRPSPAHSEHKQPASARAITAAALLAGLADWDMIKTSTGFHGHGATVPHVRLMKDCAEAIPSLLSPSASISQSEGHAATTIQEEGYSVSTNNQKGQRQGQGQDQGQAGRKKKKMAVKSSGGIRDLATAISMVAAGAERLGCSAGVAIATAGGGVPKEVPGHLRQDVVGTTNEGERKGEDDEGGSRDDAY